LCWYIWHVINADKIFNIFYYVDFIGNKNFNFRRIILSPILLEILKYFVTFRRKWMFILTNLSITYSIRNVTIFLIAGEGENYRAIFHLSFLLWCPSTIPSDNTVVSYFRHNCQIFFSLFHHKNYWHNKFHHNLWKFSVGKCDTPIF
jgi:hypothetical protein